MRISGLLSLCVAMGVTTALANPVGGQPKKGLNASEPYEGSLGGEAASKVGGWFGQVQGWIGYTTEVPVTLKGGDSITVTVTVVGKGRTVIANLADPTGKLVGGSKQLRSEKTTTFTVEEVSATGKYMIVIGSESIGDFKLTVTGPAAQSLTIPALEEKLKRLEKEAEEVKARLEKLKEKK